MLPDAGLALWRHNGEYFGSDLCPSGVCIPVRGQHKQEDMGMVKGGEAKILHSKNQKKDYAVHKQEPEQKEKGKAAQAEWDLTLETVNTAKGTWARF